MIEQHLQADRLLKVDQVDQAEDIYRRVVEVDPMDAIAVVGLARCALARGEDERAHELAARALTIDPENDMARRMEARLAEVLATRGEDVVRPDEAAVTGSREMRPVVTESVEHEPSPTAAPIAITGSGAPSSTGRRSFLDRLRGR